MTKDVGIKQIQIKLSDDLETMFGIQNELEGRGLDVLLLNEDGSPLNNPKITVEWTYSITLQGKEYTLANPVDAQPIEEGGRLKYRIIYPLEALSNHGMGRAQLVFREGKSLLRSKPYNFMVYKDVSDGTGYDKNPLLVSIFDRKVADAVKRLEQVNLVNQENLKVLFEDSLENLSAALDEALETKKRELEEKAESTYAEIVTKNDSDIKAKTDAYDQKLAQLVQDYNTSVDELEQRIDSTIAENQEKTEALLVAERVKTQELIDSATAEYNLSIQKLEETCTSNIQKLEAAHKAQMTQIESEHKAQTEALNQAHAELMESTINDMTVTMNLSIEDIERRFQALVDKYTESLGSQVTDHELWSKEVHETTQALIDSLQETLQQAQVDVDQMQETVRSKLDEALALINSTHEEQKAIMANYRTEVEEAIATMIESNNKTVEEAIADVLGTVEDLVDKLVRDKVDEVTGELIPRVRALETLTEGLENTTKELGESLKSKATIEYVDELADGLSERVTKAESDIITLESKKANKSYVDEQIANNPGIEISHEDIPIDERREKNIYFIIDDFREIGTGYPGNIVTGNLRLSRRVDE